VDLPPLPPDYLRSSEDLHAVAEQVLAAARFAAVGKVGLEPTADGFGTPAFDGPAGPRCVRVAGVVLVVEDGGLTTATHPLTTVRELAEVAGVDLSAPVGTFAPNTPRDPDRPLVVDAGAAQVVAAWFELGSAVIHDLVASAGPDDNPSAAWVWPEHFDLGMALGPEAARANYGISPGDGGVPEPYAYVGPWNGTTDDPYWNATSFPGATFSYTQARAEADPGTALLAFLQRGRALESAKPAGS
jgi:hypothetical protein